MQSFSASDLHARRSDSCADYKKSIEPLDVSREQAFVLTEAAKHVDAMFVELSDSFDKDVVLRKVVEEVPWRIAMTRGTTCENARSHTRLDVIFISSRFARKGIASVIEMLAHEKMHLYQKLRPSACTQYCATRGFVRVSTTTALKESGVLLRANPDLDAFVYSLRGQTCCTVYTSALPSSMEDVFQHGDTEHPYEHMAQCVGHLCTHASA
jgi:hypothetical protein